MAQGRAIEFRRSKTKDEIPTELHQGSCRSVHTFGQFCRIGEGTYGTVYRAVDKSTDKVVALKKVILHNEKQVGFPVTSLREVRLLKRLAHVNCVSLLDVAVGKGRDQVFLVFEYCEHDMATLIETMGKKWTESEVKCLMIQLLNAVKYLHDNWIIHRDLKMSNLLYNAQGQLKVADFGLARLYSPSKVMSPKVVTLWYRAPELLLGESNYGVAVDVWACGCIFGELLRQSPVLPGKTESEQIQLIFSLLGKPHEGNWHHVHKLPLVEKGVISLGGVSNYRSGPSDGSELRERFFDWGMDCIGFMEELLHYDPVTRITAEEALKHTYFKSRPLPQQPQFMPTYPTKHAPFIKHIGTQEKDNESYDLFGSSLGGIRPPKRPKP